MPDGLWAFAIRPLIWFFAALRDLDKSISADTLRRRPIGAAWMGARKISGKLKNILPISIYSGHAFFNPSKHQALSARLYKLWENFEHPFSPPV